MSSARLLPGAGLAALAAAAFVLPATGTSDRLAPPSTAGGSRDGWAAAARRRPALRLPRLRWEGGVAYYARFAKARAAGWSRPGFFPIAVHLRKPAHARSLRSVGINTYLAAEHDGSTIASITNTGIFVVAQREWSPASVGNNSRVVGWTVHDECEMGYSGCTGGEYAALAKQETWVRELRALNDGRFVQANFGNGVLGSYWAPNTFHQFVQGLDVSSVDKYAYASTEIHEARGIAYFQHNNNGRCGLYSIVECGQRLRRKLSAIHAKVRSLAPVLNTQSYRYYFRNGTDTMLKTHRGHAYVFAGIGLGERPGRKRFVLPRGIRGKALTVVGERRRLRVVKRRFVDRFAHEYTHHVYKIPLRRGA